MPLISIDSLDDPRLERYRDLPRHNPIRQAGYFVVEGRWLVERLLSSPHPVHSILVDELRLNLVPATVLPSLPIYVLPAGCLQTVIGFHFHRGILGCGIREPLDSTWQPAATVGRQTILVCVDIQDPTNLGGILRNGAAFGVDAVWLTRRCADVFSRRVLRVSMGTAFKLRLIEVDDLPGHLTRLSEQHGFESWATVLSDRAESLPLASRPDRVALLIGNEGHGLPEEVVACCSRLITIPMRLETDSLNAAVASGIFLWELQKGMSGDR